ncbi:hypothetical protein Esti_004884 [Eimeria stiedai]
MSVLTFSLCFGDGDLLLPALSDIAAGNMLIAFRCPHRQSVVLPGGLQAALLSVKPLGGFGLKLNWLGACRSHASVGWRMNDNECPFLTLGLSPSASPEELRSRYLQLAKQLHPDASADNGSKSASAFLELRRAYETALQLQQQAKSSTPAQAGQEETPGYWRNRRACEQTAQSKRSAEAEARRRQWRRDQDSLRSFWEGQAREQWFRQNDGEFSAAMESLLESRLHAEKAIHSPKKPLSRNSYETTSDVSERQASSTAQWEHEFADEFWEYGLEHKRKCSFSSFFRKERPPTPSAPSWTSRKVPRISRRVAAVSAAVTATGIALLLNCARTRESERADFGRQHLK